MIHNNRSRDHTPHMSTLEEYDDADREREGGRERDMQHTARPSPRANNDLMQSFQTLKVSPYTPSFSHTPSPPPTRSLSRARSLSFARSWRWHTRR